MNQVVNPITLTSGELLIDKNLTILGPGANVLTVQRTTGPKAPAFRIFNVIVPSADGFSIVATISGLTITNGLVQGKFPSSAGGGISNSGPATVNVAGCTLNNNSADFGGGIFNSSSGTVDPGTTKNGEGREVMMTPEVEELLRAAVAKKKPNDSVFTREGDEPIKDFRGAWRNLCVRAGTGRWECRKCGVTLAGAKCQCGGVRKYVGLIPHDFRRSAAKAARRAGVPESVIMAMGGWKTPSMFRRYAIVSSGDQRAAVEMIVRERAEKTLSPPFDPPAQKPSITGKNRRRQLSNKPFKIKALYLVPGGGDRICRITDIT